MATRAITPPPGFVLESPQKSSVTPPPGFVLEDQQPAQPPPTGDVIKAAPGMFSKDWFKEKLYNAVDRGSNLLPAVGGFGGGIAGAAATAPTGPGAVAGGIGGATLGGAAGESARQLVRRAMGWDAPQTSLDAAKDIGIEGAKQGAFEATGQLAGRLGRAIAPRLAETAMAPGKRLLKSVGDDVNIGQTVLRDSTGLRPKTITQQLTDKIADTSKQADSVLQNAADQGVTVPLAPARNVVADEAQVALKKNAPGYIQDVDKVKDQLANQYGPNGKPLITTTPTTKPGAGFVPSQVPGAPIQTPVSLPNAVDPVRARQIRQGVDLTVGGWNPEAQAAIDPLRQRVYGALSGALHDAVPEVAPLDRAMTEMSPARDAAWNVSFNPSITGRLFNRVARPTGALTGASFGAYEGGKNAGAPGAVAGGLAGLILPELLASPTGQMMMARTMNSRITPGLLSNSMRLGSGLMKPTAEDEKRKRLANGVQP